MKMFHWTDTEFNAQYTGGDVVVIAETVSEAREKATKEAKRYLQEYHRYDQKRYNEKWKEFKEDIAREPKTKSVLFIAGSA